MPRGRSLIAAARQCSSVGRCLLLPGVSAKGGGRQRYHSHHPDRHVVVAAKEVQQPPQLLLQFGDGHEQRVHWRWLADGCRCERCYNRATSQRHGGPGAAIPPTDVLPELPPSLDPDSSGIRLRWSRCGDATGGAPDAVYSGAWLRARCNAAGAPTGPAVAAAAQAPHRYQLVGPECQRRGDFVFNGAPDGPGRRAWTAESAATIAGMQYSSIDAASDTTGAGLRHWLERLWVDGFTIVHGVPCEPQATLDVVGRIGVLRNTLYGLTYEVHNRLDEAERSQQQLPEDSAYSGDALACHTDGTYWSDPPGLQAFHCFAADAAGGGATVLMDGLSLGQTLRREHPRAWEALSTSPIRFEFLDAEHHLIQHHTVFATDYRGEVAGIRYNPHDRAVLDDACWGQQPAARSQDEVFDALEALQELLSRPSLQHRLTLQPGDLLLIHNHRVLHGRDGFDVASQRHFFGMYLDNDEFISRLRWARANLPTASPS